MDEGVHKYIVDKNRAFFITKSKILKSILILFVICNWILTEEMYKSHWRVLNHLEMRFRQAWIDIITVI